jgi:hypothetical protein
MPQRAAFEAGQIFHNNPVALDMPEYAEALVEYLHERVGTACWNVNQKKWGLSERHPWPPEDYTDDDIGIPGMHWGDYYNWGGSPDDDDWDQAKADAPNLSFEGVEIRWYKFFGRSMNCTVEWSPAQWVTWFDRAMQTVRAWECAGMKALRKDEKDKTFCPFHLSEPCPQYPAPLPQEPTS